MTSTKDPKTPAPPPDPLERLREQLVPWILGVRHQHLDSTGANVRTHWDRIQAMMQAQARQSTTIEQWMSRVQKFLQVRAPDSYLSSSIIAVREAVTAAGGDAAALALIAEETPLLIAMTRIHMEEKYSSRREDKSSVRVLYDDEQETPDGSDDSLF